MPKAPPRARTSSATSRLAMADFESSRSTGSAPNVWNHSLTSRPLRRTASTLPDVRRCGGHGDESRALQDRSGHDRAVAVDVADAVGHGGACARGGQRSVDAPTPPLRNGRAAPDAGELRALDPCEAPGADHAGALIGRGLGHPELLEPLHPIDAVEHLRAGGSVAED